jgi:hypothetical protein
MIGAPIPPPNDPEFWKAQAERRSELLRSGKATDEWAGVLALLWSLARLLCSGLIRLCQWPSAWWRAQR